MSRKRWMSIVLLTALLIVGTISGLGLSSAYQTCRNEIQSFEGYGPWKQRSTLFLVFYAHFNFFDGFNTATCSAVGAGLFWRVTRTMKTLVGCFQSLDGEECPRGKFGVIP